MILPAERRAVLTAKAQEYAGNLDHAMEYLLSRGIVAEAAAMFQLGYVTDGEFATRLTIPYVTPAGVVQIKYRCTDLSHHKGFKHTHDGCPKYLYEAGTGTYLYNAQVLIHSSDKVVVTEGEMDAVSVQAYTGIPSVAYPGSEMWKAHPHWTLCFEGVNEIIVVADGDDPGKEAAKRVSDALGLSAHVVNMPRGEDANSIIATQGAGAFLERIGA